MDRPGEHRGAMDVRSIAGGVLLALWLPAGAAPLFPDVPEQHWAREQVASLAAGGLLEGYPDGTFKGDRVASRWELALEVARLLARMEQDQVRLASQSELEQLGQLVEGLREELGALGVRVDNLQLESGRLDQRVTELERITFYGRIETVVIAQHFHNKGPIGSPPNPEVGGGAAAQLRPQQHGLLPAVDYQRSRALTTGAGFTSRAMLGLKVKLSPDWDLRTELAAYSTQGDEFVDVYWGATPPNPLGLVTGTANNNHAPFTNMVLDRIRLDHKPSRTRINLGSYDEVSIDPLVYAGQPNLSARPPARFVGFGYQVQGSTAPEKEDRLVWEAFGSRFGEGNVYQGLDYQHLAMGADVAYEFGAGRGRLKANYARLSDEAPDGQPLLAGLNTNTNVAYGNSNGWTPVQWVNPPGYFAADRPGPAVAPVAEGDPNPFRPNTVETRPIAGWQPFADTSAGFTSGGGNYGPGLQNTFGASARYKFDFGLRVTGEYAHSEFRSNRNSPFQQPGDAWRIELGGELGDLDLTADYLCVAPTYNPDLYPNGALGRRSPITVQVGGRFFLHDSGFYPHNRKGFRARIQGRFEEDASWWVGANFLRQTRTSLYDVRSPANSLGPANPTNPVLGFSPGFIDPVFYGYANPNQYGRNSQDSFTANLEPLEDQRGSETMLGGGLRYGPLTFGYEHRHYSRPTILSAAQGGSQNLVDMYTQFLTAQTSWPLSEDFKLRIGLDYVRCRGHLDPAGLYNRFALPMNSVSFTNIDGSQVVPALGFEWKLNDKLSWGVLGRYYQTGDHVSPDLSSDRFAHPFEWAGPQITSEVRLDF